MSLYSMLPEAKSYLKKGGFEDQPAGFILMACFIGGFVGIQVISRLFHRLLPSHVVDCDHTHDDHGVDDTLRRQSSYFKGLDKRNQSIFRTQSTVARSQVDSNGLLSESTPLLSSAEPTRNGHVHGFGSEDTDHSGTLSHPPIPRSRVGTIDRRPSMVQVQKRVMSFVKDTKANCDESGPCYGYSDPCGQECFKHISSRAGGIVARAPTFLRTATGLTHPLPDNIGMAEDEDEDELTGSSSISPTQHTSRTHSHGQEDHDAEARTAAVATAGYDDSDDDDDCAGPMVAEDIEAQHHHHVPENAFLSIGLQTSIAIALHKFPEGFITYATNHASPALGLSVFLALAVHNVSEGFAMALPLYLALGSRGRAIAWSSALGGLSQPLGAALAALWLRSAPLAPSAAAYGMLFALTAGIMASVALQLFVESLSLHHDRNLAILFAFLGMALLGTSNAFTSDAH